MNLWFCYNIDVITPDGLKSKLNPPFHQSKICYISHKFHLIPIKGCVVHLVYCVHNSIHCFKHLFSKLMKISSQTGTFFIILD